MNTNYKGNIYYSAAIARVGSSLDGLLKEAYCYSYIPEEVKKELDIALHNAYVAGALEANKHFMNVALRVCQVYPVNTFQEFLEITEPNQGINYDNP